MQKPSVHTERKQKAQTCAQLPSVEAGDFNKVPDHLTWPVITQYPLDSADTLLTLPPAESIVVSFSKEMIPTSFKKYPCLADNA
jgi:endonuclease/exonuclease/phosphatase family metal-dependent hydrolase